MSKEDRKPKNHKRSRKLIVILALLAIAIIVFATYTLVTVTWIVPAKTPEIVLNYPDDDEILSVNTTYFNWTGSGGNGNPLWYVWYTDTDSTFTSPNLRVVDTNITHNYTADLFLDGDWYWRVEITDNTTQNVSETRHFRILTNASNSFPNLTSPSVLPTTGLTTTSFTYYVTFNDADNNSAVIMNVSIDDVQHVMTESDASDTNTTDGKMYTYTTTLAVLGMHNYSFICSDQNSTNSTILYQNPSVSDIQLTNEYPTNNSVSISLTPKCNITVSSGNGSLMDVSFATNSTGSWLIMQTNASVSNGTYYWDFPGAAVYETMYYWNVSVYDGFVNISEWYNFTTEAAPEDDGGGGGPDTEYPAPTYLDLIPPDIVFINRSGEYIVYCEHDRNNIFFNVHWDDGTSTGWIGPYEPYHNISLNYTYMSLGMISPNVEARVGVSGDIATYGIDIDVIEFTYDESESVMIYAIIIIILIGLAYILVRRPEVSLIGATKKKKKRKKMVTDIVLTNDNSPEYKVPSENDNMKSDISDIKKRLDVEES